MKMGFIIITLILDLVINPLNADNLKKGFDYHVSIGIPKAAQIRKFEENNSDDMKPQKIILGNPTDISHVPYQVGLDIEGIMEAEGHLSSVCGGSLLTGTRILTAAHCHTSPVFLVLKMTAVLGSNTLYSLRSLKRTVDSVHIHPSYYNNGIIENDVAVLGIPAVLFTSSIQPIALPSGNESFSGERGLISGYGKTSDNDIVTDPTLYSATITVITNAECVKSWGEYVEDTNICAKGEEGENVCHGDSGGPLVVDRDGRKILVGISSFVHDAGCELSYPAVYTRVTTFLDWIKSKI